MYLLENLKMSLLNFKFVIIYIIHKKLALLKNYLNYLKVSIFKYFFKEYNRLLFFQLFFSKTYNDEKKSFFVGFLFFLIILS